MLHAPIVLHHRSTVFYNVKTFILITWVSWVSCHKISKRKYQEVKVCTICKKIKRTAGIAYLNRVRHVRGVIDAIEEIFAQLNVQHTTDVYSYTGLHRTAESMIVRSVAVNLLHCTVFLSFRIVC